MAGPNGSRGSVLTPNPIAAAPGGERDKALASVMAQIDKQYGKGSVMRLGDDVRPPIEVIPTGSIALDVALGIGGLPRGRVVEIYGPESSGKTTVALHAVANAQKAGGIAAFIDAEHALDPDYAKALGVDTDALLVSQPDTGEQALEIADMLIRSGALDIIVIDSVAALVPRAEIEGEMGDSHVGLQARLMSQALRKITGALSTTGTTAIFINQLREKIGVMFGSPETTTGGKALKFYASVRLDVRRIETLKDGTDAVGNRTRCKVVKNKVSPPFKQAEFDILYGQGISREGGLIDMGVEQGFVRKSGAWYTYDGDQLGQGKENARAFLRDNPDLADELEKKIKEKLGIGCRGRESRPCPRSRSSSEPSPADSACRSPTRRPRRPQWAVGSSRRWGRQRGTVEPATAADPEADPRTRQRARPARRPARSCSPAHRGAASRSELEQPCAAGVPRRRRRRGARPDGGGRAGRRRRLRGDACAPGRPLVGWPAGRCPRSCGARASTTRPRRPRSRRSTRTTSRPRPRRWSRRGSAPRRARPPGADPPARRHAGPQGLPVGAGDARGARGGPRGAGAPARLIGRAAVAAVGRSRPCGRPRRH